MLIRKHTTFLVALVTLVQLVLTEVSLHEFNIILMVSLNKKHNYQLISDLQVDFILNGWLLMSDISTPAFLKVCSEKPWDSTTLNLISNKFHALRLLACPILAPRRCIVYR